VYASEPVVLQRVIFDETFGRPTPKRNLNRQFAGDAESPAPIKPKRGPLPERYSIQPG
jgi:hypothetical protein